MNKALLQRIEEIFIAQIETKNSWGKNEIKQLYANCVKQAIMEIYLD